MTNWFLTSKSLAHHFPHNVPIFSQMSPLFLEPWDIVPSYEISRQNTALWQIKKIVFILCFNGVNYITLNWGVTLKGQNLLPKGDRLRLSHENVHPFPSWTEWINFLKTGCHSYLVSNSLTFPWLSKSFLKIHGHPKNPCFFPVRPGKNIIVQIFFPDRGNPDWIIIKQYSIHLHL